MIWETVKLALLAIFRNALRSFLTVLGIVIGVAAVITMVTVGGGTTAQVTQDIAKLGSNLLFVRPGQGFGPGGARTSAANFDARDLVALRQQINGVKTIAPVSRAASTSIYGNENWNTTITGSTNEYFLAQEWRFASGRRFFESELRSGKAVCIIGETVRSELFGNADPIGSKIRLKKVSCEVIGLLATKGQSSFGQDQDDIVVMPIRSVQRRFLGNQDIQTIYVSARDGVSTAKVRRDVTLLMRELRRISPLEDDDFNVRDMTEIANMMSGTTRILTGLLGAVAAVSLLVGGIGIMNIMLVSVTERTREIGIRLAVGAQESQVLMQFLVEAVVLSLIGGLIGIALGLGLAGFAANILKVPFIFEPNIVMIAFVFSALVGVIFGYFPARRAARLNPIEALRHE
ncbi:MAG: FtsX-like permease family protein [Anderseniella sp.]|nr:FtsX-like permease family protein [Anderseniella sp.]